MSATAETFKLGDYFSEWYGPPHNRHVPAPELKICDKFNHHIYKHYLDDLYVPIPSVSISVMLYKQI